MSKESRPVGRPSDYTLELSDLICSRLTEGESMRSVCRDPEMPVLTTIFRWLREKPDFKQQYDIAKEESAETLADEMVDIADNQVKTPLIVDGDIVLDEKGDQVMIADSVAVQHAKLRIDTRKWAASKLKPKKYGDRSDLNITSDLTVHFDLDYT